MAPTGEKGKEETLRQIFMADGTGVGNCPILGILDITL